MLFRKQGQRRGRVFWWVCGVLAAILAGLVGYQIWNNTNRQTQDDALIDKLDKANLEVVKETASDPRDWPQWRGIHRDGIASGEGLLKYWPAGGPKLAWKIADAGGGFSAVSVAGKRLVTMIQDGGDEVVVCWEDKGDRAEQVWRFKREGKFSKDGTGPRATPTIAGEYVYAVSPRGPLYCLALADGKEIWTRQLTEDYDGKVPYWGYSSSPLVEDNMLLINPGGSTSAVVALDAKTGKLRWKALSGDPGYSSPVISTGGGVRQVLFFLGEELVSLDPKTGGVNWRFPWKTDHQVNAATPIVVKDKDTGDDYVFISSGYNKGCALVRVYKGSGGKPAAEQVYKNNLMKNHFGSSVFYKDHLYGFSETFLVCMKFRMDSRKTLKPEWTERGFNKGTLLLAGDHLIVLGEKGDVALVEPSPEQFIEKSRFQIDSDRCWTMPTVAQGRLYIRDEENVYCYDLQAK